MVWKIEFQNAAERELAKLGHVPRQRILRFLNDRVKNLDDPRSIGEALRGSELGEFWKYRVGDYRIIAHIEDSKVAIMFVRIGNRANVYRR